MTAIEVTNVSKVYRLYNSPKDRLRELISVSRKTYHHDFFALKDVSVQIAKGQTVGIIGQNGSGKSTLLKIISGVTRPTNGMLAVSGRVSSLLELGAGFSPEFTGRDNVYMNGALMGLNREEMERRFPEIEAFADIGEFIDQPVKSYSSGMYVRLAFAAAVHVDPDILIIDETLAVGDIGFQHKCMFRLSEFKKNGKTILFVSHDLAAVKALCDDAIYLKHGSIEAMGRAGAVVDQYVAEMSKTSIKQARGLAREGSDELSNLDGLTTFDRATVESFGKKRFATRFGSGAVKVKFVDVRDDFGKSISTVEFGHYVDLSILVEATTACPRLTVAFYIKDRARLEVLGTNSDYEHRPVVNVKAGETLIYRYRLQALVKQGGYTVTVILAAGPDVQDYYDWVEDALSFEVVCLEQKRYALYSPPVQLTVVRSGDRVVEV